MKSKFKKLMAAALVLCLMLALLPAGVLADGVTFTYKNYDGNTFTEAEGSVRYGHGTIKVESNENSGYTLTATPDDTWGLKMLSVAGEEGEFTTNPEGVSTYDFTVAEETQSVEIKAAFKPVYTVSKEDDIANGTVSVDKAKAFEKDTVNVTVKAAENYEIDEVYFMSGKTKTVINAPYSFEMPASNVTVGATFTEIVTPPEPEMYYITTAQSSYGTIRADKQQAAEGDTVNVTITTSTEYVVSEVYYTDYYNTVNVPLTGSNGSYTFVMPAHNVEIHAEYTYVPPVPTTYTVTTNDPTGGTVTASKTSGIKKGEWVTITVDPVDGYWLSSLTVGGYDVTGKVNWAWDKWSWNYVGTYSFRVYDNVEVNATYSTYDDIACFYDGRYGNVTVKVWDESSRKFVTTSDAERGDLVAIIVEPFNGFVMDSLSINERGYWGDSVNYEQSWKDSNVYYFRMPADDVNIYVSFKTAVVEHKVYVDKATDGTLKASTEWAEDGQMVYITATPDKGYELGSLYVKTAKGDYLRVFEAQKENTYYFYMPDQYVTVSAVFVYKTAEIPFVDVSSKSWYYDAVRFVYGKGIMDGVSTYSFAPDATITRGMVVTMLWRMAGEPYAAPAGFTDVASGRYYSTAVAWAAKNGIVEGMTSTTFAPNQAITREQLASILYRYAKWLGFSGAGSDISGYTDAGKVSSYAYDAMSWAVKTGVVTGTSARVLDPQGTASRAAAAQMFMNFYNYIK